MPKREAPSQHHDRGLCLCHLGTVSRDHHGWVQSYHFGPDSEMSGTTRCRSVFDFARLGLFPSFILLVGVLHCAKAQLLSLPILVQSFRGKHVRLMLSELVLARWWRLVAFMKATNHLHWARCAIVPAHHHGHRGVFCIVVLFDVALAAAGAIRSKYSPDGGI